MAAPGTSPGTGSAQCISTSAPNSRAVMLVLFRIQGAKYQLYNYPPAIKARAIEKGITTQAELMYIAMGWLCIVAIAPIIHSLSKTSFGWLLAGGIIYTVGGVIYALKIPWFENHWKNFGLHEIFHLFVMGGSLCHMILMFQI